MNRVHFLAVTWHETIGRILTLLSCEADWPDGALSFPLGEPISLPETGAVQLSLQIHHAKLTFQYRMNGQNDWQQVGSELDASLISDESGRREHGSFTGAFVGMAAFDLTGMAVPADYSYFNYTPEV